MENKVKFNSKTLLDIVFEKDVKGYNALQVDQTLDEVIKDYKIYEEERIKTDGEIASLKNEISSLKEQIKRNELDIARYKNLANKFPDNINVSDDNVTLLKRIDALERALYLKGIDPRKI